MKHITLKETKEQKYIQVETTKNIKLTLNIIDNLIAGKRFGELDSAKQMYLLDCQSKISEMQSGRYTETDIAFILKSIDSLTKILFSAKDELENLLY